MSGIDTLANSLFTSLMAGEPVPTLDNPNFTLPTYTVPALGGTAPAPLTNAELTSGAVGGTGVFDVLMAAVGAQLQGEYQAGRINAQQYSGAYVSAVQAVLPAAVQFLLGRDQSYWAAMLAEQQAIAASAEAVKALVDLEVAKAQYAIAVFQSYTAEAEFALTKAKLSTESIAYDTANYNLQTMLPEQLALLTAQVATQTAQTNLVTDQAAQVAYQTTNLLPAQLALTQAQSAETTAQTTLLATQNSVQQYTLTNMMPQQLKLVTEQANSQAAQTSNTRLSDGTTVTGLIGAQVALYQQQVTSYKRDAEVKAAKLWTDTFNTQATVNSITPASIFTNANMDIILSTIQTNNALGTPSYTPGS